MSLLVALFVTLFPGMLTTAPAAGDEAAAVGAATTAEREPTVVDGAAEQGPGTDLVQAQVPLVPQGSDPDADVDEILSDPRYEAGDGSGLGEQLRRAWQWLRDTVQALLFGDGSGGLASRLGVVVVLALLGVLAWVAIRGGRRVARDRLAATPARPAPAGPDEWEARAEQAADAGDLEGAVHAMFRALALRFGIVTHRPDEPGRTAGEVRRAAAATPPGELVAVAVDAFEAVAYGAQVATLEQVQALRTANRALASAVAPESVVAGGPR